MCCMLPYLYGAGHYERGAPLSPMPIEILRSLVGSKQVVTSRATTLFPTQPHARNRREREEEKKASALHCTLRSLLCPGFGFDKCLIVLPRPLWRPARGMSGFWIRQVFDWSSMYVTFTPNHVLHDRPNVTYSSSSNM